MMDHIEKHPSGMAMCKHCGGEVDDDGYAMGGAVDEAEEQREGEVGEQPEQSRNTEAHRDTAFADALAMRRGSR